jgi:hypothetical protein
VFLCVRIGPCGEPDVVGVIGKARPQLLAVDDPVVAVANGARLERREVGAGVGFGVADREQHFATQDARQKITLLRFAAVLLNRRPDGADGEEREGEPGALGLFGEDVLLDGRSPLAAVLRGPADAEPAVAAELLQRTAKQGSAAFAALHLAFELRRHQPRKVVAKLGAQRLLLVGQIDLHTTSPLGSRRAPR